MQSNPSQQQYGYDQSQAGKTAAGSQQSVSF